MIKKTCPHCTEEFEFEKPKQFGAHITNCEKNPNIKDTINKRRIKRCGELKNFDVHCFKCNKTFIIQEREKKFLKKEKHYCSKSCANSRLWSKEDKDTLSLSMGGKGDNREFDSNGNPIIRIYRLKEEKECLFCEKKYFPSIIDSKFCSRSCRTKYNNINTNTARLGGLASAKARKNLARSKNEIYFAELCKKEFENVLTNEAIFNGWDADIILPDYKLAILWNGKWHYEKITYKHSVKQVQNRDKIKLKEIQLKGYKPYIIKDMGKHNKTFVEKKFEDFLVFLKQKL